MRANYEKSQFHYKASSPPLCESGLWLSGQNNVKKKKTISIYMLVYKIEKVDSVLNKSSNCNTMFLNLLHCSVLSGWSLVFFYFFFPFISPKNGLARRWGAFYKDAL